MAIGFTIAAVVAGGLMIARYDDMVGAMKSLRLRGHVEMQRRSELEQRFQQGVVMLHAHRYDEAATALHRVLQLSPKLPEAHVNMGFAMIGLQQWSAARDFFNGALELNVNQSNAYYGLAIALEATGDLRGALGAMRTFLHRTTKDDPFRIKAESAVWEWEESLKQQAATSSAPGSGSAALPLPGDGNGRPRK